MLSSKFESEPRQSTYMFHRHQTHFTVSIANPTSKIMMPAGLDATPARAATVVTIRPSLELPDKVRHRRNSACKGLYVGVSGFIDDLVVNPNTPT